MGGLRIGLITTWNTVCGISEYSRALAAQLRRRGNEVFVLANHPVNPAPGALDGPDVVRFFYTGWHQERGVDLDRALHHVLAARLDVIHLQYQNFIYPGEFLEALKTLAGAAKLVVTFHDVGVPPEFPRNLVERAIVHSPVTARLISWPGATVIPMGIHNIPAPPGDAVRRKLGIGARHVFCSVGLGRTDYGTVLQAIKGLLPNFPDLLYLVPGPEQYAAAVNTRASEMGIGDRVRTVGGFMPIGTLFQYLHASDAAIFYFPETGVEGVSSSSCRLGIAARRPVVISDVGWTRDLPPKLKIPYGSVDALRDRLVRILIDDGFRNSLMREGEALIQLYSWERTALRHEEVYRSVLRT